MHFQIFCKIAQTRDHEICVILNVRFHAKFQGLLISILFNTKIFKEIKVFIPRNIKYYLDLGKL